LRTQQVRSRPVTLEAERIDPLDYYRGMMVAGEFPALSDFLRRPDWQAFGACRGMPVDVFVLPVGATAEPARAVCRRCPVNGECLNYALAEPDLEGIWAGTTARERSRLRKVRREAGVPEPVACVTCGAPTVRGERCEPCQRYLGRYGSERRAVRRVSA
jgi:WhiB family redox-sensing transcriptional regulator